MLAEILLCHIVVVSVEVSLYVALKDIRTVKKVKTTYEAVELVVDVQGYHVP